MGQQIPLSITAEIAGKTLTLETGKLAALADGSVLLRQGNLMLLATVVSATEMNKDAGFFPLSVEYREKFAAAGRIPGNFFRREARPSDYEILTSRLIDRAVRPLFPDGYMYETQIFVSLISGDKEEMAECYAATAASAAFMVSDIPFQGPIAEVRVARIEGAFVVNPKKSELANADMSFIIAGSLDSIVMVEGEAQECQEEDLLQAIKVAHEAIKEQCNMQLELRKLKGVAANRPDPEVPADAEIEAAVAELGNAKWLEISRGGLSKAERKKGFEAVDAEVKEAMLAKLGEEAYAANEKLIKSYMSALKKEVVREMMLSEQVRLDGRKPNQIRPIWSEIDYLPATHGSALFTRGETQSLTTVTLGSKLDEAMVDNAMELTFDRFMLHYNFPPFCTNEAKPVRGTSRREVGHGNLARRSILQVMPKEYPYTVRVVSDILESNGSSSMATVCAGSLALMDAGVPISSPISGIAMGLVTDGKRYVVLSDILGDEDHLGDMDFKVTGTAKGICGVQMDIKIDGLDYDLLKNALAQAREGRLHILGEMNKTIAEARPEIKPHAPRIIQLIIASDQIGAVIGTGGKIIQAIQARTGTTITIEDIGGGKGQVSILGQGKESTEAALKIVKGIVEEPELGEEYEAKIVKVMPYGAFVEFLPGKEGLLHVSELSWERLETVEGVLVEGETIRVKYMGLDERTGKSRLSHRVFLPKPEGYVEREPAPRKPSGDRPGGDRGGYRNDRGGDRNDRGGGRPPRR